MRAWRQTDWDAFLGHLEVVRVVNTAYRKRQRDGAFARRMDRILLETPCLYSRCGEVVE